MSEIIIEPTKTCAFTGHRVVQKDFDVNTLKDKVLRLIEIGYDTFLVGMAIGFDTIAFSLLEEIRKDNKISIIACVPCESQSNKFNSAQKKEYDRMIESADEVVLINKEYTRWCMQKRNEFMVNNCSCLISYVRRDYGGTVNTVKYAVKKGIIVIPV